MKFDLNDLAMAGLGALFVVFGANILSEGLYHSDVPEVAGYEIEGAPIEVASAGAEEVVIENAAMMMADMTADEGANVAKKCVACHVFEKGGANKVGPQLWDIVNREIAGLGDFGYSGALKTYAEGGKVWDYTELNGFLYKPKDHVKGTSMGFAGIKDTKERAAILAYLRSLSDSPAPLPTAEEVATPASSDGVEPAATNEAGVEGEVPASENPAANAAESLDVTDKVESPTVPAAGATKAIDPAVVAPDEVKVNTDAAPRAEPGTSAPGTATGYGASERENVVGD